MPMMNAWRPAYRALGDHALAAGARVTMTGEGRRRVADGRPRVYGRPAPGFRHRRPAPDARHGSAVGTTPAGACSCTICSGGLRRVRCWPRRAGTYCVAWRRASVRQHRLGSAGRTKSGLGHTPIPSCSASCGLAWRSGPPNRWRSRSRAARTRFYLSTLPGGFLHPLRSLDVEETFQSRRRNGLRELQPYWDPDLIQFLCRVHPTTLDRGGRTKGLVRDEMARRFPSLGFERHRKVSASTFFSERMAAEGPVGLGRARRASEAWRTWKSSTAARPKAQPAPIRVKSCVVATSAVWEMLNLEAWVSGKL